MVFRLAFILQNVSYHIFVHFSIDLSNINEINKLLRFAQSIYNENEGARNHNAPERRIYENQTSKKTQRTSVAQQLIHTRESAFSFWPQRQLYGRARKARLPRRPRRRKTRPRRRRPVSKNRRRGNGNTHFLRIAESLARFIALLTAQALATLKIRRARLKPQFRASACLVEWRGYMHAKRAWHCAFRHSETCDFMQLRKIYNYKTARISPFYVNNPYNIRAAGMLPSR